ncbi:MAG: radical SAM protein [Bacteroidetes bacterium]|nr:radical SAM protein [Bacteroidota bacterium]
MKFQIRGVYSFFIVKNFMTLDIKNSIRGWFFSSDTLRTSIENGLMLNASIDLTNACNLNCAYCYIEEKNSVRKRRKSHELSLSESLRIIDELKACGVKTINIVGAGEPTIDEYFYEIVNYIYSQGLTTILFTNGAKLASSIEIIDFCYEHDVSVVVKYNSPSHKIQDMVAGKRGYSQKREEAIKLLIKKGFNKPFPTRLGIDMLSFKGNIKDIPAMHHWCRENNVYPICGDYIPTGRTEDGKFQGTPALQNDPLNNLNYVESLLQPIDNKERINLISLLSEIDQNYGIERSGCSAYFGGSICTQILGLYIDIQGNIWPCVARKKQEKNKFSDGLLGNVRKNISIKDIWLFNSYLIQLRKHFNGGCPYKPILVDPVVESKYDINHELSL